MYNINLFFSDYLLYTHRLKIIFMNYVQLYYKTLLDMVKDLKTYFFIYFFNYSIIY